MKSLLLLLAILPLAAKPQLHEFKTRASELDSKIKEYPEIGFLIKDKKGKAQDTQYASVDTSTQSRGRLVIWLMSPNTKLFHQLNKYGLHTMQVAYANKWFSLCCKERPVGPHCRGNIRLEAATGEDHTNVTAIAKPDSIKGRALTFVKHLAKKNPEGEWGAIPQLEERRPPLGKSHPFGDFPWLNHFRPLCQTHKSRPCRRLLGPPRPIPGLAGSPFRHAEKPLFRIHPHSGFRLGSRSLLPILGTPWHAPIRPHRKC